MRLAGGVLLAATLAAPAAAQRLKAFEEQLERPAAPAAAPAPAETDPDSDFQCGSVVGELFCDTVVAGVGVSQEHWAERRPGDPVLPAFRLDATYQRIVKDLYAGAVRAEAGWGALGAAYEYMKLSERDPSDTLTSNSFEALLRTFGTRGFRLDWAAGYRVYTRSQRHGGAQAGFSLGVYPWPRVGFEGDLRWGSIGNATVSDYHARVTTRPLNAPFGFSVGYRALRAGDATLHGPEVGATYVY